jgi:hypothetical protein
VIKYKNEVIFDRQSAYFALANNPLNAIAWSGFDKDSCSHFTLHEFINQDKQGFWVVGIIAFGTVGLFHRVIQRLSIQKE